ncbi:Hypothetical protein, putative [Bodo saltans]|uniref:Probable methyltransferase BMT2 homolog n=1 Tax=Bodo saltans TaxID=75058 RepID=A0A0S4ISH9_BODSA|nr:Hypothetical protein, putative [Bodo saltans]|eukprot:CUF62921.1 Hypothetical protein, putative [Bodo saltans]
MAKRPREEDESAQIEATSSPSPNDPINKDNLVWSSFIKAHHQRIRDSVKADHGGNAEAAWRAVLQDQTALAQYATSMHHLATKYWDTPSTTSGIPQPQDDDKKSVAQSSDPNTEASAAAAAASSKFRYDDRIEYALSCIQEYFIGPVAGSGGGNEGKGNTFLPFAVTVPLKQAKRDYYSAQQAPMPEDAQLQWIRTWLDKRTRRITRGEPPVEASSSATSQSPSSALTSSQESFLRLYFPVNDAEENTADSPRLTTMPSIRMLDVGSCYAPFEGKSIVMWNHANDGCAPRADSLPSQHIIYSKDGLHASEFPLDVVSVDLAPYPESTVWPCDWLGVDVVVETHNHLNHNDAGATAKDQLRFDAAHRSGTQQHQQEASAPPPLSSYCGRPHVLGIHAASFDVITFSLVLSYMPTPQMRFEACRKAYAVLREHGLLVVISTRTQGPRQATWVNDWISAIETIGFVRVHKHVRCRLIGMTFQKVTGGGGGRPVASEATLAQSAAKMVITADTI